MDDKDIDFVITWVDGNDPDWQMEKNKYLAVQENPYKIGVSEARFRDWDLLQFWFRSIDKFAPWVRKIHFVTCGQIPEWLNLKHQKLHVVNHRDFIPERYLPTFNSHTIEFNIHRIDGLSERFVYFNDDMYLCQPTNPKDFFIKGLPCDSGIMNCLIPRKETSLHYQLNALSILNDHFLVKDSCRKRNLWFNIKYGLEGIIKNVFLSRYKYFVGFQNPHLPQSYLKSVFNEIWDLEGSQLDETCKTKFRTNDNISIWLTRYWQLAGGQFFPVNPNKRGTSFVNYDQRMLDSIESGKYKMVCVNDFCETKEEFETWQPQIHAAFEKLLPEKSDYEI